MLRILFSSCVLALALFAPARPSSAQDSPEIIRQKIEAAYPLTKTTATKDDIVTAGAVLVLEKDGLEMSVTTNNAVAQDTYKGGKVSASGGTKFLKGYGHCTFCSNSDKAGTFRTFVAGEKFWLTKVEVHDDGVLLSFFSDPISDVRYISVLKIPFTKGQPQSADALLATIAEVIKVQPSDDAKPSDQAAPASQSSRGTSAAGAAGSSKAPSSAGAASTASATASAAAPTQTMAPIAPPPPPPDSPAPTVSIGQTRDQVLAILGKPTKTATVGATKQIDFYPDMKVTYIKNKVTDIQ